MNFESYYVLKETVMRAEKDLQTGIREETLDKLLENNFIDSKNYLKVKESIKALKSIIDLYTPMLIEYEKANFSVEDLFNIESNFVAKFLDLKNWDMWLKHYMVDQEIDIPNCYSIIELTNDIAIDFGFENWHIFFNAFPYPRDEDILNKMIANRNIKQDNKIEKNKDLYLVCIEIIIIIMFVVFIIALLTKN